ncbi:hypothetical protein BDF14DRAFT_1877253 [Spinellus fusiger]|nr:hypothetical protein BDF14DRAFT_1877253 [Spinellus fusiger]
MDNHYIRHWKCPRQSSVSPKQKQHCNKSFLSTDDTLTDRKSLDLSTFDSASLSVQDLIPALSKFHLSPSIAKGNFCGRSNIKSNWTNKEAEEPPPVFAYEQKLKEYSSSDPSISLLCTNRGIQPVKVLLERLEAWQLLSKRLYDHFELLAQVEANVAKSYKKLEGVINGGYYTSNQERQDEKYQLLQQHFTYEGGIRKVCDGWQEYHDKRTKCHMSLAVFLQTHCLPNLSNIKKEIKGMIKAIRSDERLKLSNMSRMKKTVETSLDCLGQQLAFFEKHPDHGYTKRDPWLMNAAVIEKIIKMYYQENKFHETVLRLQQEILISEEQLIEELRTMCQQFYALQESSELGVDRGLQSIMDAFQKVTMNGDWLDFAERAKDNLISEKAAFHHPDRLVYPHHMHPLLQPVFSSRMERRSSILHHWREYIYVLTPSGFLHEYKSPKNYPEHPDASIFVPHYKVSTPATHLLHQNLVFHLQPQAIATHLFYHSPSLPTLPREWGSSSTRLPCSVLRPNKVKLMTFRAKSVQDMQNWLELLANFPYRFQSSKDHSVYSAQDSFQMEHRSNVPMSMKTVNSEEKEKDIDVEKEDQQMEKEEEPKEEPEEEPTEEPEKREEGEKKEEPIEEPEKREDGKKEEPNDEHKEEIEDGKKEETVVEKTVEIIANTTKQKTPLPCSIP